MACIVLDIIHLGLIRLDLTVNATLRINEIAFLVEELQLACECDRTVAHVQEREAVTTVEVRGDVLEYAVEDWRLGQQKRREHGSPIHTAGKQHLPVSVSANCVVAGLNHVGELAVLLVEVCA